MDRVKRSIYLWAILALISGSMAMGTLPRRMHGRSTERFTAARHRHTHSRIFRQFVRRQRSTWNLITQQYSSAREANEAAIQLFQARRLQQLRNEKPWWGQWSSWSACGRTCGSGVQFQQRHCLGGRNVATHKRGKLLCEGPIRKYRICSPEPCPPASPSFRKLQCSQLSSERIRGKYYVWKPYGHPDDEIVSSKPCQLVCTSQNNERQKSKKALDGTECRKGWDFGRCVKGKCQFIGCDGKINSTRLRNKCGTCDDEGEASCEVVDDNFSYNFNQPGDVKVVRIPKDSYDILILGKQRIASDIVLKDRNGSVLFRGRSDSYAEDRPRNVLIAGVEFRYRQPGVVLSSTITTYLLTIGPIKQEIVLHIARATPGEASLHYEFKVPLRPSSEDLIRPLKQQDPISHVDPDLTTTASVKVLVPSISFIARNPTETPSLRQVHLVEERPDEEEHENILYIRVFDTVSSPNAESVDLLNQTDEKPHLTNQYEQSAFIKPKYNGSYSTEQDPEPISSEIANDIAAVETVERIYQGNAPLSITGNSGPGTVNHNIIITEVDEDSPTTNHGSDTPDVVSPPGTYVWQSAGFSPCSSTCRSGLQDSYTSCKNAETHKVVDDRFCDPVTRPEPVRQTCKSRPCEARWEASPWSECSKSCGAGEKSRSVRCWKMISPGFDSTIYNELCANISGVKPREVQPCKVRDHCGPLWETSDWTTCNSACDGYGTKRREVRCSGGNDNACAGTPKPHALERCKGKRCLMKWIVSDWGECSGECGRGRKIRSVLCFDNQGRRHPEFSCDPTTKPDTSHPCGDRNCRPEWIVQEWNKCSAECGQGIRQRVVSCSGIVNGDVFHYNNSAPCNATLKPPETSPCELRECDPVWLATPWSQCSVTCGTGRRTRRVNCYRNGSPASGCDQAVEPSNGEPCSRPACPKATPSTCRNKASVNCVLVKRVNLCSHWYYEKACCEACRQLARRG